MSMNMDTTTRGALRIRHRNDLDGAIATVVLSDIDQRVLMETLARIHGFTLVDREERKELLGLVTEVEDDENDYSNGSDAWGAWQDRCEALAGAVSSALRFENDGEV